jgi:hypothetical protein
MRLTRLRDEFRYRPLVAGLVRFSFVRMQDLPAGEELA